MWHKQEINQFDRKNNCLTWKKKLRKVKHQPSYMICVIWGSSPQDQGNGMHLANNMCTNSLLAAASEAFPVNDDRAHVVVFTLPNQHPLKV
mmetsp:Transcript_10580/g.15851  ORF Transcript_10580/g.15851 Transcript_10580/m.15851 type:complete len:91 (-) Transcript_10580:1011-1283(-)